MPHLDLVQERTPDPTPDRIISLVMAAGLASRFGSDKRQARLPDGRSLLEAVLQTQRAALPEVWVLTRPADAFAASLCAALGCRHIEVPEVPNAPEAGPGMGRTLSLGLSLLSQEPDVSAALVALADMPWVRQSTVEALLAAHRGREHADGVAIVPVHQRALGHPRVLPRSLWPALLTLRADEGARQAVDWSAARRVEVDDPGVLIDIDTPGDLSG